MVRLPLTTAHIARQESSHPLAIEPPSDRPFRILVVDDERSIRRAYERLLRPHEVVGEDGEGALARLQGGDTAFDLILCDLMMPGVDGIAVYGALGKIAPDLRDRLIFSTGGAFREEVHAWLERTPVTVLPKPTSRDEILAIASARRAEGSEP